MWREANPMCPGVTHATKAAQHRANRVASGGESGEREGGRGRKQSGELWFKSWCFINIFLQLRGFAGCAGRSRSSSRSGSLLSGQRAGCPQSSCRREREIEQRLGWERRMSVFLYFILPVVGGYALSSVYLLRNPHVLHRKKRTAFYCTHISHRGGTDVFHSLFFFFC